MTIACLAKISPMDASTGSRTDIYVSSANDAQVTGLNSVIWEPAMTAPPQLSINLWNGDFQAAADPGGANFIINMDTVKKTYPAADTLKWFGAPVEIHAEEIGTAWPWTTRFKGTVTGYSRKVNALTVNATVDPTPFDQNVLTATYAGTGGAEGGSDVKNTAKPLILGWAQNVEPILIDATNSVYQFSGYGAIEDVTTLYERGSSFGAVLADYATYTALVAATIAPGRWATCLAAGMIRLGAPAAGVITGDVKGHKIGSATPRVTADVISALATLSGVTSGRIDSTSLSAFASAVTYPINIVVTEQIKFRELANKLTLACNWMPGVSLTGQYFMAPVAFGGPEVLTVNAQGAASPQVTQSDELDVSVPYFKTIMGANRCWRVHTTDEIAFYATIIEKGRYSATTTYREGNVVDLGDGSRWLYINATAGSGNAPPAWPTTTNAYWDNLTPPSSDLSGVYLTNESHVVSCLPDGSGGDYTTAGGTFKVWYAGVDVTTSATFTILSTTGGLTATGGSPNVSIDSSTGVYTITGLTADDGTATFQATYSGLSVTKVYSITKNKSAKALSIISDRQSIYYDSSGTPVPSTQTTTFSAVKVNTAATVTWSVTDINGTPMTPTTSYLSSATGDSVTMTQAQFAAARNATTGVIVTGTLSDGGTLMDKISVVRVTAGANGSNGSNGTNGTNGANGTRTATLYLYKWSSTTPSTWPSGTSTYTWATGQFTDPATLNGWSRTIGTPGAGDKLWRIVQTYSDTGTSATSTVTWSGTYTPEQYTPTLGDLAGLNSVATVNINANAVTNLTSAYTQAAASFPAATWTTIQTITFTATGAPVAIKAALILYYSTTGAAGAGIRITRNGTDITGVINPGVIYADYMGIPTSVCFFTGTISITDTPASGSVTYNLDFNSNLSSAGGANVTNRYIEALETKR